MSKKTVTVNSILVDTHRITVDWLKLAEAKALGLAGLNILVLFGIHRLTFDLQAWLAYKSIATILLLISIAICFLAVLPRIGRPSKIEKDIEHDSDSDLLFYGDISKYSKTQYQQLIKNELSKVGELISIDDWYITQIWVISRITIQKLAFFNTASWFFLTVVLTPVGALILHSFKDSVAGEFHLSPKKQKAI